LLDSFAILGIDNEEAVKESRTNLEVSGIKTRNDNQRDC